MPAKGKVFACAIDATGKELGADRVRLQGPGRPNWRHDSSGKYAPKPDDAREEMGQGVCRPPNRPTAKSGSASASVTAAHAFMLARWLDDHNELLEQDYVLLKIDDCRDLHGDEVAKRLTGGEGRYGIPFHAIFDSDGRMLINSNSPIGNIGYPSGFEGKKHLRKMLMETRSRLTDKQIEELVASLND